MIIFTIMMSTYIYSIWREGAEFLNIPTQDFADYRQDLKNLNRRWRISLAPYSGTMLVLTISYLALSSTSPDGVVKFSWMMGLVFLVFALGSLVKKETLVDLSYRMYGMDYRNTIHVMIGFFIMLGALIISANLISIFG